MKVLLINHFPLQGSGSGIYTLNIAEELLKRGNEVFVLDVDNRIDDVSYGFMHKSILFKPAKNAEINYNFPCFTTHPRSNNTFYNLTNDEMKKYIDTMVATTKEIAEKFKPDIIHAQHLWIAPYAAYKSGVPYVITAHGTDLMGFKKDKRYRSYAVEGAKNSRGIITISKQVYEDTLKLFDLPSEKVIINPNGFDDKIFRPMNVNKKEVLKKLGTDFIADKVVSFVGKFTEFKGIDILIKAAKIVSQRVNDVGFYLAGDGELRKEMEKLAKNSGLKNVTFLGHQTQENVALLYNIANLSVVPSRVEPFGLVAIEALACGTPVVATNAGGLPDFINENVGKLVEMDNPKALAEGIIEELKNNTKKSKGTYAAKYAKENYSWQSNLDKVIALYNKVLN